MLFSLRTASHSDTPDDLKEETVHEDVVLSALAGKTGKLRGHGSMDKREQAWQT